MTKSDVESEGSKSPRHVREGSLKSVEEAKDTQETKSLAERKKLIIDRQKTCPMLLRLFCKQNGFHRMDEFRIDKQPLDDELVIYTWKDATLKELCNLIKEVHEEARNTEAKFHFRLIYQDNLHGSFFSKDLGTVCNAKGSPDDVKNLDDARFVQGDFLDVSVVVPLVVRGRGISQRDRRFSGSEKRRMDFEHENRNKK